MWKTLGKNIWHKKPQSAMENAKNERNKVKSEIWQAKPNSQREHFEDVINSNATKDSLWRSEQGKQEDWEE